MTKALSLPILKPPRAVSPCPATISEPQLFLDRLDPIEQLAQPMNPGDVPLRLWQGHSRRAKPCAARQVLRNARLRGDDGILSNNDIVRDLHKIVDLNAFLDPGPAESSAINGCVCPDLNVVVNLDNSELRNFLVTAFDEFEPKTIREIG